MKRPYSFLHNPYPERFRVLYWVWNLFWMLFAAVITGGLCLLISYGDYPYEFFTGYLANKLLLVLNLLPMAWLLAFLYAVTNRAWIAFLGTGIVSFGLAIANYFKLLFRDEPLVLTDLQYIREGTNISQRYDLTMDWKLWLIVAFLLAGTILLGLLVRGRVRSKKLRLSLLAGLLVLLVPLSLLYRNSQVYYYKAENPEFNTTWATTQYSISKGFWYSFLYSSTDITGQTPDGYKKREVREMLEEVPDEDIPEEEQVDVLAIQLEAFADLSDLGIEGISEEAYAYLHELEEESYSGSLVTSTFAAGTIITERSFLTGLYYCETIRHDTDSYVWYFRNQGYRTAFTHGGNEWFYNRANVCDYLGFEEHYFLENYFDALTDEDVAYDDTYLPAVYDLYDQAKAEDPDQPYFGFHITYQGHGPYSATELKWGEGWYQGEVSGESYTILNNYLGSVADTQARLKTLVDRLRERDDPVVLVLYGDHMPWLGDGNSVYQELGVNLDLETQEGFYNYYSTPYLIWANDAAKEILGDSFTGQGPSVSPMYLMGLVFDRCGWEGMGLTQLQRQWRGTVPVLSSAGYSVETGVGVTYGDLSDKAAQIIGDCICVNYYKRTNFTMR